MERFVKLHRGRGNEWAKNNVLVLLSFESAINLCNRRAKREVTIRVSVCVKRNGHRTKASVPAPPSTRRESRADFGLNGTAGKVRVVQTRKKGERSNGRKRFTWTSMGLSPSHSRELNIPSVRGGPSADIFENSTTRAIPPLSNI